MQQNLIFSERELKYEGNMILRLTNIFNPRLLNFDIISCETTKQEKEFNK